MVRLRDDARLDEAQGRCTGELPARLTKRARELIPSLFLLVDQLRIWVPRNETATPVLNQERCCMKKELADENAAREGLPTTSERKLGTVTAGVIALVIVGTAIYWIA